MDSNSNYKSGIQPDSKDSEISPVLSIKVHKPFYSYFYSLFKVYSVTDRKTFTNLTKWIEDVNNNAPSNVVIALAGNKSDL